MLHRLGGIRTQPEAARRQQLRQSGRCEVGTRRAGAAGRAVILRPVRPPPDGELLGPSTGTEVDPGFGTGRVVGSEPFRRMLDGANDEKDETEDRRGAEGEDCAGGAAGTVDGCGPVATVRSPPEPDLRLEEAAAGAGGPRL